MAVLEMKGHGIEILGYFLLILLTPPEANRSLLAHKVCILLVKTLKLVS